MEEIVFASGKRVYVSATTIYYKNHWINSASSISKIDGSYNDVKNIEYVDKVTDVCDMINDGRIFNHIMESTFDEFMKYIIDALYIDDIELCKYVSYYDNSGTYEKYTITDNVNPDYKLIIKYSYYKYVSFKLNGRCHKFDINPYECSGLPIKNYLFYSTKSARADLVMRLGL